MPIIEITDFQAPELDVYARLTENQLLCRAHPEQGIFIAESPKVVERALDAGCQPLSFLMERKHITGEAAFLLKRCPDIPVYTADFAILTQLTGFQLTRGVLCAMRRPAPRSIEEVCAGARRIAVLENVMNPTNVGAIFRSAAALGMDAVLLTPACSNPLYRRAIRVSMGTVFQIPWAFFPEAVEAAQPAEAADIAGNAGNIEKAGGAEKAGGPADAGKAEKAGDTKKAEKAEKAEKVEKVEKAVNTGNSDRKQKGFWPEEGLRHLEQLGFHTAAMALTDDSISLKDPRLAAEEKLALVLGTEGDGLSSTTIARCTYTVKIPMYHGVDSLNVAAASAVAFYQLADQNDRRHDL